MGMTSPPSPEVLREARRILVCLRWGIGDVVMELPILAALRRAAPEAHITALGAAPATELLDASPLVDEVVVMQRLGVWSWGYRSGVRAWWKVRRWARSLDFDHYFDILHAPVIVRDAMWKIGIPTVESDGYVLGNALGDTRAAVSAFARAAAAGWNIEVEPDPVPELTPPPAARHFADRLLDAWGLGSAAPPGVSPIASMPLKRWPAKRFAEVADELVERSEAGAVLLFHGPQRDMCDRVLDAMRRPERAVPVGPLHLQKVAALLERCSVLVCNDTGLLHMASAVGTPVVGLYGPTNPGLYRPPRATAVALGGREPECPHRRSTELLPPECWREERCLIGPRSCIERSSAADVVRAAERLVPLRIDAGVHRPPPAARQRARPEAPARSRGRGRARPA